MTKKFIFKAAKETIIVDKKARILLKSYTQAIKIIYKYQPEIILDLEKSLLSDLKYYDSISHKEVCEKISQLHSLDNSQITEILTEGSFSDLGSTVATAITTPITLLLILTSFNSATLYLFSLPLALLTTSLLIWLLPSKVDQLTTYFVSNIESSGDNDSNSNDEEMLGGVKNKHVARLTKVLFKAINIVMSIFLFWFIVSSVPTYISVLMYKFGLWPVTLMVQTNAYSLSGFALLGATLLSLFTLFVSTQLLFDFLKEIKYTYFNSARFIKRTAIFVLLILVFIPSNYFLNNQPATISSKSFDIANMEKLLLLNNSLCSSRYNVIVQKNNQNTVIISGDSNKVQGTTIDTMEKGSYTVTNIYPFQTCVSQKPIVTIVVNSDKGFVIDRYDIDNQSFNLTLVGFGNDEVPVI